VGTDADGYTTFPHYNHHGDCQTIKGIRYQVNGRRDKAVDPRFGITTGGGRNYRPLSSKYGHVVCLFGAQYLASGSQMIDYRNGKVVTYNNNTVVMLVESEKSAVLGSYHLPQYVWIATGGAKGLTEEKAQALRARKVMILYDADTVGLENMSKAAHRIREAGGLALTVDDRGVSLPQRIFGRHAPDGYDVADHVVKLLESQSFREYTEEYERECIIWANQIDATVSISPDPYATRGAA
jgi:hypothetical protein